CAADGTFEYDDAVAPDQQTRLTASAPGYIEDESDRLVASPGNPAKVEFRLIPEPPKNSTAVAAGQTPRRVVSGTVRGPDSKPAVGVLVRWGYQPYSGAIDTRTDAHGFYKLT